MAVEQNQLIGFLETLLRDLRQNPYVVLQSPENTKRRASVALIIRVNPSYKHWPESIDPSPTDLESYFRQEWVQHGNPEVLFMKRASRKGDRWTSHIALPGGMREPTDADDKAAAIREAWEEVGIDLKKYALECGNLPQRLVTTHWGKKPLLVLCPYVFLVTAHEVPSLRLQPTEVAETHWVPLKSLQSGEQRTIVFEEVSSRLANQETGVKRWMLSMILGQMQFAAINLVPTESLSSVESPAQHSVQDNRLAPVTWYDRANRIFSQIWRSDIFNQYPPSRREGALLLWGLTLGVITDFLDFIPPHNATELWTYPTFTPLDVRIAIWLMTYRFKGRKRAELQSGAESRELRRSPDTTLESVAQLDVGASTVVVTRQDETGFHGLGTGSGVGEFKGNKAAVTTMLEGYYDIVRRAVGLVLIGRFSLVVVLAVIAYRKYWKR